jgi:hypothetical protein
MGIIEKSFNYLDEEGKRLKNKCKHPYNRTLIDEKIQNAKDHVGMLIFHDMSGKN